MLMAQITMSKAKLPSGAEKSKNKLKPSSDRNKRYRIWQEQGGKCFYCDNPMWVIGYHKPGALNTMATTEHILPPKLGGARRHRSNLVCSCSKCNRTRGQIPHETFIKIRKQKDWQQLAKQEQWKMLGIFNKKMKEHQHKQKFGNQKKLKQFRERILKMIRIKVKQHQAFVYV